MTDITISNWNQGEQLIPKILSVHFTHDDNNLHSMILLIPYIIWWQMLISFQRLTVHDDFFGSQSAKPQVVSKWESNKDLLSLVPWGDPWMEITLY